MILVVLAALCLVTVPVTGGHLSRLGELRLRWLWLAPLALAVQVLIVTVAPSGDRSLHTAVHIGSYVLIGIFVCANLRVRVPGRSRPERCRTRSRSWRTEALCPRRRPRCGSPG